MLTETNLDIHRTILERAESMRPLPQAVLDLARTVSSADAGIKEVAQCLRSDPVLTAVVLREANSAYSGARDAAATVEQGVVRLGGARVLAISVAHSLPCEVNQALPGYGIYEGGLHAHAVATSHAVEIIRSASPVQMPASVVTAALLHDIGKILLANLVSPQLIPSAVAGGELITAAERALFDLDHTEVGSALAAHWKLPDEIVQAIRFHHEPSNGDSLLAHAVAVADVLSHRVVGDQADVENEDEHDDQLDLSAHLLGLDLDQMETKILERLDRAGLLPTSYEEA